MGRVTVEAIMKAWARIREIDSTIPDEVLDYMKDASVSKLEAVEETGEKHLDKLRLYAEKTNKIAEENDLDADDFSSMEDRQNYPNASETYIYYGLFKGNPINGVLEVGDIGSSREHREIYLAKARLEGISKIASEKRALEKHLNDTDNTDQ